MSTIWCQHHNFTSAIIIIHFESSILADAKFLLYVSEGENVAN